MKRLDPPTIELLIETLATSFWYKKGLLSFLRSCGAARADLEVAEQQGAKYNIVRWLVERYEQSDRGHDLLREIGTAICRKAVFSDLTPEQVSTAQKNQRLLRTLLDSTPGDARQRESAAAQDRLRESDFAAGKRVQRLAELRRELDILCGDMGTASAGKRFEEWIVTLATASGLDARGRYSANGREFDGSLCVDADVYLIEAKFRQDKADASEISNLRDKVSGHADGALGLFVSMGGYTSNAIDNASRAGTPLVLIHSQHLFTALGGQRTLADLVRSSRRHAKETGCPIIDLSQ